MEIKIPLGQMFMKSNHVDKRTLQFELLSPAWSISRKYAEKIERFSVSI